MRLASAHTVVNVALVVAGLTCLGIMTGTVQGWRQREAAGGFVAGQLLRPSFNIPLADVDRRVVLVITTRCRYCTASMDFYKALALSPAVRQGRARLTVISPEPIQTVRDHLASHKMNVDDIISRPLGALGVRGTPTLLVLDRHNTIEDVYEGQQAPEIEGRVLALLR